jgi:hypothetical protein
MFDALLRYAAAAVGDQQMRKMISLLVFPLGATFSDVTSAQKEETTCEYCWIDSASGKPVPTIPLGTPSYWQSADGSVNRTGRTHIPSTGQDVHRRPDGCWVDSATGKEILTIPLGTPLRLQGVAGEANRTGSTYVPSTGQHVVRVSCSPTKN